MKYLSIILFLICGTIWADSGFQKSADIEYDKSQDGLIRVPIPEVIYNYLRSDYNDMQLFSSDKKSVESSVIDSYIIGKESYNRFREFPVKDLTLTDGSLSLTVYFDEELIVDTLYIRTPIRNFELTVSIKDAAGKVILDKKSIFDYSNITDSRSDVVHFPAIKAKELFVTIDGLNKLQQQKLVEVLETDGDSSLTTKRKVVVRQRPQFKFLISKKEYRTTRALSYETLAEERVDWKLSEVEDFTVITIDPENYPLRRIRLLTTDTNFSRKYYFRQYNERRRSYMRLSSGDIEKWNYRNYKSKKLTMAVPNSKDPYELVIINGKKSPLSISGLEFVIAAKDIYFLAEKSKSYSLHFSDSKYRERVSGLPEEILVDTSMATVGKLVVKDVEYVTAVESEDDTLYRLIIIATVILIVLFLIWAVYSTAKKVESSE